MNTVARHTGLVIQTRLNTHSRCSKPSNSRANYSLHIVDYNSMTKCTAFFFKVHKLFTTAYRNVGFDVQVAVHSDKFL